MNSLKNFYENNNLNYFEQFFKLKKDLNSNFSFNFDDSNENYYNNRIIFDYLKEIKNEEIEFSEIFDLLLNKEILNKENIKNFLYDFLNIILNIKTFTFKDSKYLYQKISKILHNENNYENIENILNLLEIIYNVKNKNQNFNMLNYYIFLENGCKLNINNKINYKIIFNLSFSFKCIFKENNCSILNIEFNNGDGINLIIDENNNIKENSILNKIIEPNFQLFQIINIKLNLNENSNLILFINEKEYELGIFNDFSSLNSINLLKNMISEVYFINGYLCNLDDLNKEEMNKINNNNNIISSTNDKNQCENIIKEEVKNSEKIEENKEENKIEENKIEEKEENKIEEKEENKIEENNEVINDEIKSLKENIKNKINEIQNIFNNFDINNIEKYLDYKEKYLFLYFFIPSIYNDKYSNKEKEIISFNQGENNYKIHCYLNNRENIFNIGGFDIFIPFFTFINIIKNSDDEKIFLFNKLLNIIQIMYDSNKKLIENENKNEFDNFLKSFNYSILFISKNILFKIITEDKIFIQKNILNRLKETFNQKNIIEFIIEDKLNEKIFYNLEKNLFFNNGFWNYKPNKSYYYKIYNFVTNDFKKPVLLPILNINKNYKNLINNDEIFNKIFIQKKEEINEDNLNDNMCLFKNENKDMYLYSILNYEELIKDSKEFNEQLILTIQNKYFFEKEINLIKEVCRIKQTHHINGFILFNNEKMVFHSYFIDNNRKFCTNNISKNNNCFGSIFECPKYEYLKTLEIKIKDIKMILQRYYYFKDNAFEIYTFSGKNYYFNSNDNNVINLLFKIINKNNQFFNKKYDDNTCNLFINKDYKKKEYDFIKLWKNKKISNFNFVMLLNIFANRSYLDLYQYPIFPWIIFPQPTKNNKNLNYRNLSLPMGQNIYDENSKTRLNLFDQSYDLLIEEIPIIQNKIYTNKNFYFIKNSDICRLYYYNTNYSNPVYTSYYLLRSIPFTFTSFKLQGNYFDDPNRLFSSYIESCKCALLQKSDVKELIPEFYFFWEMFVNYNNINFFYNEKSKRIFNSKNNKSIDNINELDKIFEFPLFYNKNKKMLLKNENKYENFNEIMFFVLNLSRAFESNEISNNLNDWIDLIFGTTQKIDETYLPNKAKIQEFKDNLKVGFFKTLNFLKNKITDNETKEKINVKNLFRPESYLDNPEIEDLLNEKDNEKKKLFYESVEFGVIPKQILKENCEKKINENYNRNFKKNIKHLINKNIISYLKNPDFKLRKEKFYKKYFKYSISAWEIIEQKNYLLIGNSNGELIIFKYTKYERNLFDNLINLKFKKKIINHTNSIVSIYYNDDLNLFITFSLDCYINIYTINFKLINSFKDEENIKNPSKNSFVYLISHPIPSIIIYNHPLLISYSLNVGLTEFSNKVIKIKVEESFEKSIILKDLFFEEILITTDKSRQKMYLFSLPELNKYNNNIVLNNDKINNFYVDDEKKLLLEHENNVLTSYFIYQII